MDKSTLELIRKLFKDEEKTITSAVGKDELMTRVSFNEGLRTAHRIISRLSNNEYSNEYLERLHERIQ